MSDLYDYIVSLCLCFTTLEKMAKIYWQIYKAGLRIAKLEFIFLDLLENKGIK